MATREIEISPSGNILINFSKCSLDTIEAHVGSENKGLYLLFIKSYIALVSDSPYDNEKPMRLINKFFRELINKDPLELITHYSSLADELLNSMNSTSDYTITGEFLDEMKNTPIFREYLHFYRTGDAACLKFILSFLYFGKKMDYIDANLASNAFRAWSEIEAGMGDFGTSDIICELLRIIISQLVPTIDDSIFLPKHGPGYTSEGFINPMDKMDNLSLDPKSRYTFRPESFGRFNVDRVSLVEYLDKSDAEQVGRLKFVPKNVKTMRSICMEPISRMYLQQEVSRWIVSSFRSTCLHSIVSLEDQEPNRQYALHGSYSQACDTIDLSAASDRIHIDLIRRVFPRKILFYLLGTRTNRVKTESGIVELRKFAPMGSALCFPIQCILFSSIVLLSYLKYANGNAPYGIESKQWIGLHNISQFVKSMHTNPDQILHLLRPRVYGDDIICDYRITDNILDLLAQCGLLVNLDKSFIGGSPFRESCGIFAYNGEDVTPFFFRVPSFGKCLSAKVLASTIDQINRAGDYRYNHLRSQLINWLKGARVEGIKGHIDSFIPFTTDRDVFGIFTNNEKPAKVTRYCKKYQRDEKKVLVLCSVKMDRKVSTHSETYAYDQWMRARIRGGSAEMLFSASRIRPSVTRVKLGWTPT